MLLKRREVITKVLTNLVFRGDHGCICVEIIIVSMGLEKC